MPSKDLVVRSARSLEEVVLEGEILPANPYLEEATPYLRSPRFPFDSDFNPTRLVEGFKMREILTRKYAWAIPNQAALDVLRKYAPIIEIGAGTGYWAFLLRQMQVDIVAYDIRIPDGSILPDDASREHIEAFPGNAYHLGHTPWTDVLPGGPEMAGQHPNRTLFLCWPPYQDPMASDCLKQFKGNTVIYVGEGGWGCTGDDEFHDLLEENFVEIEEDFVAIPRWEGVNDRFCVYRRPPS